MTLYKATRFANQILEPTDKSIVDILTGDTPAIVYTHNYGTETIVGAYNYGKRNDAYSHLIQLCFSEPEVAVPRNGSEAPGKIVPLDKGGKFNELIISPQTQSFYSSRPLDGIVHQVEQAGYKRNRAK